LNHRAFAQFRIHIDPAVMILDNAGHSGHPHPAALKVCGEKGFKYPISCLLIHFVRGQGRQKK